MKIYKYFVICENFHLTYMYVYGIIYRIKFLNRYRDADKVLCMENSRGMHIAEVCLYAYARALFSGLFF